MQTKPIKIDVPKVADEFKKKPKFEEQLRALKASHKK